MDDKDEAASAQPAEPPPGLSAAKLRAWKRQQRILANGANRMKLVTGQTKELELAGQSPATPDENKQGVSSDNDKGGAGEEQEDTAAPDKAGQGVDSNDEASESAAIKKKTEETATKGEEGESKVPRWERRWTATSKAAREQRDHEALKVKAKAAPTGSPAQLTQRAKKGQQQQQQQQQQQHGKEETVSSSPSSSSPTAKGAAASRDTMLNLANMATLTALSTVAKGSALADAAASSAPAGGNRMSGMMMQVLALVAGPRAVALVKGSGRAIAVVRSVAFDAGVLFVVTVLTAAVTLFVNHA